MISITRLDFNFVFFMCFLFSSNFNAQKINQFDAHKKRTGLWEKYYPNKRIRYQGQFKNGKEIGVFKFYDITNSENPTTIKTYSKTSNQVAVSFYSIQGVLQSRGFFVERKRVGQWNYYFLDGKIMSEEFYEDGNLEGKLINYYPNGKFTEISNYKNGLKNGTSQKYSSKGVLIEEITFKNGTPNGFAKYFELSGLLKETGVYKNGKRVGQWEYYMDGEKASAEDFRKKKKFTKKN
jgi:antitoxin component YwqK of YwqJK toxin-antitoxin module